MKTKSYFRYITIFFISTQFIFSGLNEAASNDVFLTEDQKTDEEVCQFAEFSKAFAAELDRRKLDCEILSTVTSATQSDTSQVSDEVDTFRDKLKRCWDFKSTHKIEVLVEFNKAGQVLDVWFDTIRAENDEDFKLAVREVERAFFDCGPFPSFVRNIHSDNLEGILLSFNPTLSLFPQDTIKPINNISIREYADNQICRLSYNKLFLFEAKRRGLTCDVDEGLTAQVTALSTTSTELLAAQQKAEALKQQLAELQSQQSQPQQATSADTQIPLITITRADTDDKKGIIAGRVSDNVGVAEVTVDGITVPLMSDGSFEYSTYVPATGLSVVVEVTDLAGLSSSQTVTLERNVNLATASISFDRLNPISKPAKQNSNALALIIGVSDYENTPAQAIFADTDAIVFHDYASEKLGIPENRIKTLVNDGADEREMLLAVQSWLSRSVKQDQTDVYMFFAGHGLASDDGQNMYLLPYDGSPELLDDTAILRDRLFNDIAKANPRSVTVFLDTCYSGSNRGSEMLIADARPILLKAKDAAVPEGFTVFTAAAGDETAKSLEEAKHGMFSYFLMKGMEGDADTNGDKQITAGELHAYVKSNVVQQSSGTQTPELQGDEDRVLVRFQ